MGSSSHNDDEGILALDNGVDDRDSASSSSSEGADDPPAQAPSQTSQLYVTPDARSHTSSIGQRVRNKLTTLSGGRVCILTKESTPKISIEAAHLVPRAASGTLLAKLEFSFGLNYKRLHIDTTGNLVYIRVDLHRSFDNKGWLLLPETDVIREIQEYMQNPGAKTYKQVFTTETKFRYRIIPLQLFKDETTVFQRISKGEYRKIFPVEPFSPPTVESHANPFFVIANAGAKLEEDLALLPTNWRSNTDILAVLGLWIEWKTVMPTHEWLKRPRFGPRGDGRRGHGDGPGGQTGSRRERDSPTPRSSRSAHFSASGDAGAGTSPSGNNLARASADLPQLDRDDNSDTTESDILTHDAVRAVGFLDRSDFFAKWLHGMGCSTSAATPANPVEAYEMCS
ncbi:HNHc domain-containing protein [Mycena venus]|uniref:HNHc domain-containing protein n=1 Tax=Mycena venus TaxID=2733690 RepID=A0A8H7DHE4_9AGAR|nr:HNHc domain-containing protein [Mycena venus]